MEHRKPRHERLERLLQAAQELNIHGPSALAKSLNESDQTVTNWAKRGVSKNGAIKAQTELGISVKWVMEGVEPKLLIVGKQLVTESPPNSLHRPTLPQALPVVLEAMAAVRSRAELRQLLPMLVDTNAEAYRTRLLELLQEAASNQPQEQEARVNPAYQDLADAEVKLAEDRKRNEKKHGRQPPAAHAA